MRASYPWVAGLDASLPGDVVGSSAAPSRSLTASGPNCCRSPVSDIFSLMSNCAQHPTAHVLSPKQNPMISQNSNTEHFSILLPR